MKNKVKVSIVKVIPGIETNYGVEGVRNSVGKIEDGKFIDSISEYDVVENYDMLFANLEAGKELAVMINEAEDVKVKRFKNPFSK